MATYLSVNSQISRSDVINRIAKAYDTDPEKATKLYQDYNRQRKVQGSVFYDSYSNPTNQAVARLQELGFDTRDLNSDFINRNRSWIQSNLDYRSAVGNTPGTPKKNASVNEQIAYQLYQWDLAESRTQQAEKERQEAMKEASYWAQRKDRNYSDDQIINLVRKDFKKKYSTLASLEEETFSPIELNRGIDFSDDVLRGAIWAGRNGGGSGDYEMDMLYGAANKGNVWQYDEKIANLNDPMSEEYLPYATGGTNLDDAAQHYGVLYFPEGWTNDHKYILSEGTDEDIKFFRKVQVGEQNFQKADKAVNALYDWMNDNLAGMTNYDEAKLKLDRLYKRGKITVTNEDGTREEVDLSILKKMDESMGINGEVGTTDLLPMTRMVNYKYDNVLKEIKAVCEKNAQNNVGSGSKYIDSTSNSWYGSGTGSVSKLIKDAQDDKLKKIAGMYDEGTDSEKTYVETSWSASYDDVKEHVGEAKAWASDETNAAQMVLSGTKDIQKSYAEKTFSDIQFVYDYENDILTRDYLQAQLDEMSPFIREFESPEKDHSDTVTMDGVDYKVNTKYIPGFGYRISSITDMDGNEVDSGTYSLLALGSPYAEDLINTYNKQVEDYERHEGENERTEQESTADGLRIQIQDLNAKIESEAQSYEEKKQALKAAREAYDAQWYIMDQYGLDTSDLYVEDVVLGYMANFADYEATAWNAYNPSDAYRIALASGADREEVYKAAEEGNQKLVNDLEDAKAVKQYLEELGVNLPKNYIENLDRHIAKLERDIQDYETFTLSKNEDFKELAQKGRDMEYENRPKNDGLFSNRLEKMTKEEYFDDISNYVYDEYDPLSRYGLRDIAGMLTSQLTEDEKDIYYYLMAKGEEGKAINYINSLTSMSNGVLHTRYTQELQQNVEKAMTKTQYKDFGSMEDLEAFEKANPDRDYTVKSNGGGGYQLSWKETNTGGAIGQNILAVLASPISAMMSLGYGIYNKISGEELNPDNVMLGFNNFRTKTREQTAEEIVRTYGEGTTGQKVAQFFYEMVSNRLDSMANMMAFGGGEGMLGEFFGASPMGISAAMDAMIQAKRKGASDAQAWKIGGVTFLAETATEAISLENIQEAMKLGKEFSASTIKDWLKNWLKKAGPSELIGESINDIVENLADEKIMGELSDHANLVWQYRLSGMKEDEAEAAARMDEIKGVLRTAVMSYLSPGLDIFSYAKGRTDYYFDQIKTRHDQRPNESISKIIKDYREERSKVKEAIKEAEQKEQDYLNADIANGEGQFNYEGYTPETKAQAEQAEAEARAAEKKEDSDNTMADWEILETASQSDTPTQTASIAATLDIDGTDESKDRANAAAVRLSKIIPKVQSVIDFLQSLYIGTSLDNLDSREVKAGIQFAALGGEETQSYQIMQTEAFQNAAPNQQAKMLATAAYIDMNNNAASETINQNIYENRVAEAEKNIHLADTDNMIEGLEGAVDTALDGVVYAQEGYENQQDAARKAAAKVTDAKTELLANPTLNNKKRLDQAINHLNSMDGVTREYEQALDKAKQKLDKAERALNDAKQEKMTAIRQQAVDEVAKIDAQRKEMAEQRAVEEQKAAEQAVLETVRQEEIQKAAQELNNFSRLNAEDFVREKFPNISEDEYKRAVKMVMNTQKAMGRNVDAIVARKGFLDSFTRKFGLDYEVTNNSMYNARIDPTTKRLQVSKNATQWDVMYAVLIHEITHLAEQSATYNALADAAMNARYGADYSFQSILDAMKKGDMSSQAAQDVLAKKGIYDKALNKNHSYEDILKEIVADSIGSIISGDEKALADIASKPNLARRIINAIKSFINKCRGLEGEPLTQAQKVVDMLEAAVKDAEKKGNVKYSLAEGEQNAIYILDGTNQETGETVDFINMMLDGVKLGETRKNNKGITTNQWLGLAKDGQVYGRVLFGKPYQITNTSPEYESAKIKGTEYDIGDGETTWYYPVLEKEDFRDNPKPITRPGSFYKQYNYSIPVTDSTGEEIGTELPGGTFAVDTQKYSLNSFNLEEQDRTKKALQEAKDEDGKRLYTDAQIDKYMEDALSIASMIAADRVRLDFLASDNQSFLKPNNDYYFTLDASTLCAKRLLYQGTFDYVQHALPDEVFTPSDLIDLANIMNEMGYETPCGICYVESRRRWLDTYAQKFLDELPTDAEGFIEKYFKKAKPEVKQAIRESYTGEKPSIDDLTTSDGLDQLRHSDPNMYKAFVDAMNKKGTANPKVVQLRTEYRGDIAKMTKKDIQKVKDIGGLRIQSFSDFETPHLLDMIQAVYDMASVGLTSQAYTKVPNFAWVFGDTGIKINLSLIGKGTGLDENGNLVFDNREGINFDEAMKLRERYNSNVGTILVGINDDHIIAAMGDPRIDYIIPFHKSGWSQEELQKMPTLNHYSDYTNSQNELMIVGDRKHRVKEIKDLGEKALDNWIVKEGNDHPGYKVIDQGNGKYTVTYDTGYETESFKTHKDRTGEKLSNFEPVGANHYWEFDKSGEWNANKYLKMCADAGRIPKFSQFLVDNGDGSFSLPQGTDKRSTSIREGYWKTLVDFKMYENDGYGRTKEDGTKTTVKGSAQQAVTPNVNMNEAYRVMNEYQLGRQMPDRENGQKGAFLEMKSNNDVPVATDAGDRYIELIRRKREGNKPVNPDDTLHASPSIDVRSLGKSAFHQSPSNETNMNAATTFGATQAPAVLGNTESEQVEAPEQQMQMAIDAETGETVQWKNSIDENNLDDWFDQYIEGLSSEELNELSIQMFGVPLDRPVKGLEEMEAQESAVPETKEPETAQIIGNLHDAYMDAVNSNDMATANKIIDTLAKKAGYTVKGTHRTNADFTVFDRSKQSGRNGKSLGDGFYVAAGEGTEYDTSHYGKNRMRVYINPGNAFNIQDNGFTREEAKKVYDKYFAPYHPNAKGYDNPYTQHVLTQLQKSLKVMDYVKEAAENAGVTTDVVFKELGYDSIKDGPQYCVFDPEQIKSAEPITYDDQNIMIDPDERFNKKEPDYRYSLPSDAPYLSAVDHGDMDEAQFYVNESADKAGYKDTVYHGTPRFGFTEFNLELGEGTIFVGYDKTVSKTYADNAEVKDIGKGPKDYYNMTPQELVKELENDKGADIRGSEIVSVEHITPDQFRDLVDDVLRRSLNALEGLKWPGTATTKEEFAKYAAEKMFIKESYFNGCDTPKDAAEVLIEILPLRNRDSQSYLLNQEPLAFLLKAGVRANMESDETGSIFEVLNNLSDYIDFAYKADFFEGRILARTADGESHMLAPSTVANILEHDNRSGVYELFARPGKQLVVDAENNTWHHIPFNLYGETIKTNWDGSEETVYSDADWDEDFDPEDITTESDREDTMFTYTRKIAEWAKSHGYDSVRINNIFDSGTWGSDGHGDIGIFFNPNDVKSADTVTYDDEGNVIPLSERFNTSNSDIRYSLPSDDVLQQLIQQHLMTNNTEVDNEAYAAPLEGQNPQMTTDKGPAQRQSSSQTLQKSDELDQKAKDYIAKYSSYFPDTNADQVARAIKWIRSNKLSADSDGFAESVNAVTSKNFDYRSADGQARIIAVMGMAAARGDVMAQMQLEDAYARQGTDLARALQARKIFFLMTPEGRKQSLQKMLDQVQEQLDAKGIKANLKFSDWITEMATVAESEAEFRKVRKAAAEEIAEQIPANWKDRLRSLRMLAMLGNPRTHIRNIAGNALFVPVVGMKNKVAAAMELALPKGQRTKTTALVLNSDVRNFAKQDAKEMKDVLTGEAKYNELNPVDRERKAFKGLLQAVIDFNSDMLEKEDWLFLKGHYTRALGGWMQANGYTAADMEQNSNLLAEGRAYAVLEAQKATYRDFNELAKRLNDFVRNPKTIEGKVGALLVESVLPFKKTPANILRRGLEYSGVGLIKSLTYDLRQLGQYNKYMKGEYKVMPENAIAPNQWIDKLASGLTGTGIMALGWLLSSMGIITCGVNDDDDPDKENTQNYSIKILGTDYTYTIDWAAPGSIPLFVGAALNQDHGEEMTWEDFANAIANISEPLYNLSMLEGLSSVFKTSKYDDTDVLTQILTKIGTNYVSSYYPSAFGAATRTFFDDTRRKSFVPSDQSKGPMGTVRYAAESLQNKIPFASQSNIPYRDIWGNPETSGFIERLFENFISPGYIQETKNDPVLTEMSRLYDTRVEDSDKIMPGNPPKTYNGHAFSAEEYDKFFVTRGQTAFNLLTQLMSNKDYQNASDEKKVQMIANVWSYAKKVGLASVVKDYEYEDLGSEATTTIAHDGKVNGYKSDMLKSLEIGDMEGFETMLEALYREDIEDSQIKTWIGNKYRPLYKSAYRKNNRTEMARIESILDSSGYYFDILNWEEKVDAENEKKKTSTTSFDTTGRYGKGNIDLNNRKVYTHPDGSISTEISMSFYDEDSGKEVLIPTVINGKPVSDQEAIDHYYRTGEYLGKFDTPEEADQYADMLHNRQEWYYNR